MSDFREFMAAADGNLSKAYALALEADRQELEAFGVLLSNYPLLATLASAVQEITQDSDQTARFTKALHNYVQDATRETVLG